LAGAIVRAAEAARYPLPAVDWIREEPGAGLRGSVAGASVRITNRARAAETFDMPPGQLTGLECVVIVNDRYAATYRFHDVPRPESRGFVLHLGPRHGFTRTLLVSGDREAEVRRLAESVAITEVHAPMSPRARRRSSSVTASMTRQHLPPPPSASPSGSEATSRLRPRGSWSSIHRC
jgi:cation transport ATPase